MLQNLVENQHMSMLQYLVEKPTYVNATVLRLNQYTSMLQYLVEIQHTSMLQYLVENQHTSM
jgi:hypothetical protein